MHATKPWTTQRIVGVSALVVGYTLAGIVAAGLSTHWYFRVRDAQALGFDGWFERRAAAIAGFSDAEKYRTWKTDIETKERVQRETARREQEVRDRPQLACFAAQNTIKERLRDASVARFPSCLQYPDHVTAERSSRWIVHSWVELPDASGLYRSHGFEIAVEHDRDARQYRTYILSLR